MSSDPSHPVVVLSRGPEEPETLIGVLPQQALVAPGKPGQITLEQGGCYFCKGHLLTPLYGLAAELASSQTRKGMMVRANKSSSNLTNARRDNKEELRIKIT